MTEVCTIGLDIAKKFLRRTEAMRMAISYSAAASHTEKCWISLATKHGVWLRLRLAAAHFTGAAN